MNGLEEWLDPSRVHALRGVLAGVLLSATCGVLGCFIVLRRMAFLGDALAHAMLAGVVIGYLVTKALFGSEANVPAMLVGSVLAGAFTSAAIAFVSRFGRVKEDAAIGIIYTGVFALGGVLASFFSRFIHVDLVHFVSGSVLSVGLADLWMIGVVAAVVLSGTILFFRHLQLATFDPVMAAAIGLPIVAIDYALTGATSLVVVAGVNLVGVILVVGLLVTPAATAHLLCDRLDRMLATAGMFGVSGFLVGYALAHWLDVAPGSAIVVSLTVQFLAVLTFAPRHGLLADWLRRRNQAPQVVMEDVLGGVLRSPRTPAPLALVVKHVPAGRDAASRAADALVAQGLLIRDAEGLTLTETGMTEAKRIQRAHRLWETYLARAGVPAEGLHPNADKLEHMHDPETVGYLDDKLGHPLTDPHGSEIPGDERTRSAGAEFPAALLRPGQTATVVRVDRLAASTSFQPGDTILAGARSSDGERWKFVGPGEREIEVDHHAADAIFVRRESP